MTVAKVHPQLAALDIPTTKLPGVGPERAALLAKLDIHTIAELLLHRPHRYEDRRQVRAISALALGEPATFCGKVVAMGTKRYSKGRKSVFELILDDGTARLHCRWWNLPYMESYFAVGDEVLAYGKPRSVKPRTIDHPETEVIDGGEERSIHLNRIAPIYPLTEGLPQRWLRALIWRTLEQYGKAIQETETLLAPARKSPRSTPLQGDADGAFLNTTEALRALHFPNEMSDPLKARERLAFDEFLSLQLVMRERRRNLQSRHAGLPCGGDNHLIKPFLSRLGFQLTDAQTRVLREIRQDLKGSEPMRRLLQGDVGSGKTAVAACAALMAMESGFNVALMAPTEILAEQHFQNFKRWFEPLGIDVQLHTSSHKQGLKVPSSKFQVPSGNAARSNTSTPQRLNASTLTIGTHALIEDSFSIERLGLVVIDEQHKFGVAQRERLVRKGHYPHLLVMTATPIPRTLGLTLYGDLDTSVIDKLPPGRAPIRTFIRTAGNLPKVWTFIRSKLKEGRQAYVVYPRVEDAGVTGLKAVTKEWEALQHALTPFRVGLLHGQLKAAEKETVMSGFRTNRLHILLTTPLIEVGVDVPNATVMLIENAEQFGLAQLHQLRGRIGRGAQESHCILVASAKTREAQQRLSVLAETTDGFKIAEADLKLRGPGDLLGRQQSGLPPLRFGDLTQDLELIELAREQAARIVASR